MGVFAFRPSPKTTGERGLPLNFTITDTSNSHSGMLYMCSLTATSTHATPRAGEISSFTGPGTVEAQAGPVAFHFEGVVFHQSGDYSLQFHVQRMASDLRTFDVVEVLTHTLTIY
ncbi:hypothetical protein BROUX41_004204 [Berkeleyomyces rouxiae]|uniref:uncharacterized protein n=1 Tax=Berkeleyomyces rouxiae TaxID=2035830 RepID=UPI003B79353B